MSKRQAAAAGAGEARQRLGRSADADDLAACAAAATRPRRSARSASGSASRSSTARSTWPGSKTRSATTSTSGPRACMAVLRPLKVVIENYPEGQVEELEAVNNPEDAAAGHAQGAVLAGAVHRAGRLPRGRRRRSSSGSRRAARCGCATPTSSSAPSVVKDADGQRRRAALHLRPGDARRQRAGRPQGEGDDPLGLGRSTPSTPRCGSTITCSRSPTRTMCRKGRDYLDNLNPELAGCGDRGKLEPSLENAEPGDAFQFERLGYFCVDPRTRSPARRSSTAR